MDYKPILTIGALGDSITTAFNAAQSSDNLDLSWSTGKSRTGKLSSHAARLERIFPAYDIKSTNVAVTGSRAAALSGQTNRLLEITPDYVTLLIGANDLTDWLLLGEYEMQLENFAREVRTTIQRLITANPRIMILVAGVPDQSRVVEIALQRGPAELSRLAPWLNPTLIDTLRRAFRQRHERLNQALIAVAEAHPGNVRFSGSVARTQFERDHLSPLDFYHPSEAGQALLAERTWGDGFFP